ncbi:MAG: hypothetical protein PHG35_09330 [Dehalococcoidales bacterium]|jgi:NADH pyrophosphatase NudC (nudix superfamily)|nr:hypothetical protein [Sphaerochaeta sp.]MDD5339583.1 hypothetical protein [Dehalococcoidales bacterium]
MNVIDILSQTENETGIDVVDMAVVTAPGSRRVLKIISDGKKELFIVTSLLHCQRCLHNWKPRGDTAPKFCPKCNSPYWDSPRRK